MTQKALDDLFFNVESERRTSPFSSRSRKGPRSLPETGRQAQGVAGPYAEREADGTRAFGTLQCLKTGVADGFKASNPADDLVDLIYALKRATVPERSG